MAVRKIKTGRRAGQDERQRAQDLADEYRRLRDGGAYTEEGMLNPDGTREHANPNMLLFAMERFAKTGTFAPVDAKGQALNLSVRLHRSELKAQGLRGEGRMDALVNRFRGLSEHDIQRIFRKTRGR